MRARTRQIGGGPETTPRTHTCWANIIALYFIFMLTCVSVRSTPNQKKNKTFIWRVAATQIIVEQHVARVNMGVLCLCGYLRLS